MKKRLGITYDQLFHAIPDHYLVLHNDAPQFTIIDASDSYLATIGASRDQLVDNSVFEAVFRYDSPTHRQSINTIRTAMTQCLTTGRATYAGIVRYDTPGTDGEYEVRFWEMTNYPIMVDGDSTPRGIIHASNDVTTRVKDDEHLALVGQQYSLDARYGLIGRWRYNPNSQSLRVDRAVRHLLAMDGENEQASCNIDEFLNQIHVDDRDRLVAVWEGAIATKEQFEIEHRLLDDKGGERWVSTRGKPVAEYSEAVSELIGVMIDITERKRAEQQLIESEKRLLFLADTMPQMVWTATSDGRREYFNQRWMRYTGAQYEQLVGDGWMDYIHPEDRDRVRKEWYRCVLSGDDYEIEYRIRQQSGDYQWFIGRGMPYRNRNDGVEMWYGTLTNIDVQKRDADMLEQLVTIRTQELEALNADLERSNQELQDFAYVASHDLQEPLRKIQAFGDLLHEEYRDNLGEGGEYLERMQAAAARMSVLIADLLMFSRVATRANPPKAVDLNMALDQAISDLESRLSESSGRIERVLLPTVYADPTHMWQLFQNLISNALKFHRPDKPPVVKIGYRHDDKNHTHVITVKDNGIGFDSKYKNRIFVVFQRLHGRSEYQGTGIGLAVCRKIVERYGGSITATSRPGKGAIFTISLPDKDIIE